MCVFVQTDNRIGRNVNVQIRTISVYLANAQTTQFKLIIQAGFTQYAGATLACPKTLNMTWCLLTHNETAKNLRGNI